MDPMRPVGSFFAEDILGASSEADRQAWNLLAQALAVNQPAPQKMLDRVGLTGDLSRRVGSLPPYGTRDGRRAKVVIGHSTDRLGCAWLSLFYGVHFGRVRLCAKCRDVFLWDPKHPKVNRCRQCRPGRGAPRAKWLPDALRQDWRTFYNRMSQQWTRHPQQKKVCQRQIQEARRDAGRVTAGKMSRSEWKEKWLELAGGLSQGED